MEGGGGEREEEGEGGGGRGKEVILANLMRLFLAHFNERNGKSAELSSLELDPQEVEFDEHGTIEPLIHTTSERNTVTLANPSLMLFPPLNLLTYSLWMRAYTHTHTHTHTHTRTHTHTLPTHPKHSQ